MNLPVGAVHHIPGRIRIRLPFLKSNAEGLNEILTFLDRVDGVLDVQANILTGSILIQYEPGDYDVILDRIAAVAKDNFGLLIAAAPSILNSDTLAALERFSFDISQPSRASVALNNGFHRVDKWLRTATENSVDIRSIVPLGLAGAAILRFGAAATPLWVALAVASFTSFVALNPNTVHDRENGEKPESDTPRNVKELIKEVMSPNA